MSSSTEIESEAWVAPVIQAAKDFEQSRLSIHAAADALRSHFVTEEAMAENRKRIEDVILQTWSPLRRMEYEMELPRKIRGAQEDAETERLRDRKHNAQKYMSKLWKKLVAACWSPKDEGKDEEQQKQKG
jgi:hypothetical protein